VSGVSAAKVFSDHAAQYTALRRRLVPGYDRFYGSVVEVLALMPVPPRRILDLGAGTGLLSARVADAFPEASVELLDASPPMLAEARERLGERVAAVHIRDMAGPLPEGPFDAIVSALAIHHLSDDDKRALMVRAHARLAPGGVFVNAEQAAGSTPWITDLYRRRWLSDCRALGAGEPELADAAQRMTLDRCADVESQLQWLRDAGFAAAECVYRDWRQAVICGFTEAL
jgi:tRNA (cmo5U34)-methyltransferase